MELNDLHHAPGAHPPKKRLGRGMGSGLGKTSGRGHKGQRARAGGYHKVGFEGGQMPLQRRLPKRGFRSYKKQFVAALRLGTLSLATTDVIDLEALKLQGLVPPQTRRVKVYLAGAVDKPLTIGQGIFVSQGARAAILAAGGKIEEGEGS